jgi:uncharacterized protein
MLQVNLRAAADGPVETNAEIPAADPAFADLEIAPVRPVRVSGRLMASGPGSYYWEGRVRTAVRVTCRRCLATVTAEVGDDVRLLFTEDEDNDDPSAVAIPPRAGELELADVIREALILAAPEFPLCREDCRGLCPRCGADLNDGPCGCRPEGDPRWAALQGLPTRPTETEEESR